jgi:sulfate/thiosulfate transport system substrate-binding protein
MTATWTRIAAFLAGIALLAGAAVTSGCGGTSSATGGGDRLSLVAYSTPQEAYQRIIPAFQRTAAGRGVQFDQSYGASGDQERAVEGGLPADVVALSLQPDVTKLVKAGLVAADWNRDHYRGFVTNSIVVFVVRKGNPKHIETWDDLVRPGVQVIEPNPFTSGGARWNVMAAYGAQIKQGRSPAQAEAYLGRLFQHVPVQDKSARESLQTFTSGKGDVLLAYENEAIAAQQKGQDVDFVRPTQTILIQNPVAVVKDTKHRSQAEGFVGFLRSTTAQRIFADKGYRPVVPGLVDPRRFPRPTGLFRIDDLGGWSEVSDEFFDPSTGKVARIEQKLGVSTAK